MVNVRVATAAVLALVAARGRAKGGEPTVTPLSTLPAPTTPLSTLPAPTTPPSTLPAPTTPPSASPSLDLVFRAGGATWVALDVPAAVVTSHRAFRMVTEGRLVEGGHDHAALAAVTALPAAARAWRGREVVVEGTCHERLEQFALVARVSGEPTEAEQGFARWTPDRIVAKGAPVLAARLARCTGVYAQLASSPPVRPFVRVRNRAAAARARAAVLASQPVGDAPETVDGRGVEHPWRDSAAVDTIVARDPATGTTWVSAQAHMRGFPCEGPTANVWGLYRVRADGTLVEVALVDLQNVDAIEDLVDVDGDGTPELAGVGAFGPGPIIVDTSGSAVLDLTAPSFSL